MKVIELLSEALKKKKKIPKPKPRPPKNLWYQDKDSWHDDLTFSHGSGFALHHSEEEEVENRNFYATDPDRRICYGMWQGKNKRGITFYKPKHLAAVKNPRVVVKPLDSGPATNNNITSRPT